jgi:hypothetical protein
MDKDNLITMYVRAVVKIMGIVAAEEINTYQ